ncbi:MAG: hypothetical protein OIF58_06855 [Cohaesibacter sp.]|nr:hypothetical protein [Cohaesibacter sp.]
MTHLAFGMEGKITVFAGFELDQGKRRLTALWNRWIIPLRHYFTGK